jgi:glycosyltransferase involved in cell wall biosynthesis
MRILIHAPAARMGGARAHVLGMVPELAQVEPGDEVLLVAQPDLLAELPALPATWILRAQQPQQRGSLTRLTWEQLHLPRIAEKWRADVLLSFGSFVPLRAGCPTVLEAGNALPFTHAYWRALRRESVRVQAEELGRLALLLACLRSARRVLAPTRAMRTDVVTSLPQLAERVDVAPWGVASVFHHAHWRLAGTSGLVLGVSKHGINKEFDVLVAALRQLVARRSDVCVWLTGTPDESRWSRRTARLAQQLGMTHRVRFLGDVPNARLPDLVAEARVLVLPTWCESFGLPLAEALAMGAPALAADIPACREVGADAACYYRAGDAASMASSLGDLLDRLEAPSAAEAVSHKARERGSGFTWRANAVAVRDSLRKAVASA